METTKFNTAMCNIKALIKDCTDTIADFSGQDSVRKWSVLDLENKIKKSRILLSQQDKVLKAESYHFCHMDKDPLTEDQKREYDENMSRLCDTRPKIEILAKTNLVIPGVRDTHTYTCEILGVTLEK